MKQEIAINTGSYKNVGGWQHAENQAIRERCVFVDIVKGWAMLTIIIFHCSQGVITGNVGQVLGNPWNVPVFFIIAGFFLKEDSLAGPITFLKGKLKRLYLPATIIYALSIVLHNVFVKIGWYPLGGCHPYTGAPFEYLGMKEIGLGLAKVFVAGGSGELVMGAMWFIYTLLYAFVVMTLLYWIIGKVCKVKEDRFYWMTICLLLMAVTSCVLSQKYGITVSRFSTALTAVFLIWWGMIINRRWKWSFDKWWGFVIAVIVFIHCILMQRGGITLARNDYQDLVQLVIGCTSIIYIWGFIGKKVENTIVGRFMALMGRESLYMMAFHIMGFFICNSILVKIGVFSIGDKKGLYTYVFGDNALILLTYVLFGIGTSFALLYGYRGLKNMVMQNVKAISCILKER